MKPSSGGFVFRLILLLVWCVAFDAPAAANHFPISSGFLTAAASDSVLPTLLVAPTTENQNTLVRSFDLRLVSATAGCECSLATGLSFGRKFVAAKAGATAAKEASHLHHAWPKYLGGPKAQDLQRLPKSIHDAFHSGLDKILPRQRGTAHYENLGPVARQQMQRDLSDYTRAFDAKYGTQLYESMLRNGFPGP